MRQSRKSLVAIALTAVFALTTAACSNCGSHTDGVDTTSEVEVPSIPDSPQALSNACAALLPEGVTVFAAIRDPRAVAAGYAGVREHFEAVLQGDLGMVETDLRNTLGIDLARASSLEDSGVSAEAGFAVAVVDGRLVGLVALSNQTLFHARLTAIVSTQPFDFDAPIDQREMGGHTTFVFGTERRPELAVTYRDGIAILIPDAEEGVDEFVSRLLGDGPRLGDSPDFASSVAAAGDAHVHVFLNPDVLISERPDQVSSWLADRAPDLTDPSVISSRLQSAGPTTVSLTLEEGAIGVRIVQKPRSEAVESFDRVTAADGDPGFASIAIEDVYAFARLTIAPDRLLATVRDTLTEEGQAALDASIAEIDAVLENETVAEILPALGSQASVFLTRARLLTLSRAMNNGSPGEFFSGLGVVIAFELDDPARARSALERLAELMTDRAATFEVDSNLVVEFTDAQSDIGNIVVTDRFALLVPARQRAEVIDLLDANARELSWLDSAQARDMLTESVANGLFLDVERISEGPIGQVAFARLPVHARRFVARVARLTFSIQSEDSAIVAELHLRFRNVGVAP